MDARNIIMYKESFFSEVIVPVFSVMFIAMGLALMIAIPAYNANYNQEYQIYNNVLPSNSKIEKSLGNGWFVVEIEDNRYLMQIKGSIVLKVVKE